MCLYDAPDTINPLIDMNVFVLGTGRTGSTTFIAACRLFTNFSVGHETQSRCLGVARLSYPDNHIEADNRLSWLLGRLDAAYGREAFYVHLRRDPEAVARSYAGRWSEGLGTLPASYHRGIVHECDESRLEVCRDLVGTVVTNVELFLRDKPHKMTLWLERAALEFPSFCEAIGAYGDLAGAAEVWTKRYNATPTGSMAVRRLRRLAGRWLKSGERLG